MHKADVDYYCSDVGGISKITLRVEGPPDSNRFTHCISITGTRDPSLSIAISKFMLPFLLCISLPLACYTSLLPPINLVREDDGKLIIITQFN